MILCSKIFLVVILCFGKNSRCDFALENFSHSDFVSETFSLRDFSDDVVCG